MTEDNVIEFCQWLVSEKGIEAGNLSDYINNNEEEVLKLAEEFKKPKFKFGGKVEAAAEKFQNGGGVYDRKLGRQNKRDAGIYDYTDIGKDTARGSSNQGAKIAKAKAVEGFEDSKFIDPSDFSRGVYRMRKRQAKNMDLTRRQRKAYALTEGIRDKFDDKIVSNYIPVDTSSIIPGNKKTFIPIIETPQINQPNSVAEMPIFSDPEIDIAPIAPRIQLKSKRDIAGWDQFMFEVSNHANKSGAWRPNQDGIRWQRWNELQYGKYVADPENFVWENMPTWFNDRNLTRSQPTKGVGYVDPNMSYIKFNGQVKALPEMYKCGGKTKKTKKTKKAQKGAVLKSFNSLPYGRSTADLAVLPNDLNKNKADSLITVPADFGGEYTLIKDGITGKIRGDHQSEMSGIKQMDAKKAYQMFRKFADMFNRPIEKHEDGNKINRIGITIGNAKNREFNDLTGKYLRTVYPKDTVWNYNNNNESRTVYTTPDGYWGVLDNINGQSRALTDNEIQIARDAVESRVKNFTKDERIKYLLNRYGDEMLLPENKTTKK